MVPFVTILGEYLAQSPLYLVWLAGIVYALVSWRRHPRVSLLALAALAILIANAAVGTVVWLWLPGTLIRLSRPYISRMGLILSAATAIQSLIDALAFGLLLAAVFVSRGEQAAVKSAERGAQARPGAGVA